MQLNRTEVNTHLPADTSVRLLSADMLTSQRKQNGKEISVEFLFKWMFQRDYVTGQKRVSSSCEWSRCCKHAD